MPSTTAAATVCDSSTGDACLVGWARLGGLICSALFPTGTEPCARCHWPLAAVSTAQSPVPRQNTLANLPTLPRTEPLSADADLWLWSASKWTFPTYLQVSPTEETEGAGRSTRAAALPAATAAAADGGRQLHCPTSLWEVIRWVGRCTAEQCELSSLR